MSTALLVVFLIAGALATCGVLSWKLHELNEAAAFARVRYEQNVLLLRSAYEAAQQKLNVLKEIFESPTGIVARVTAQRELAVAIRSFAPHLPARYPHVLTSLQATERFLLSIPKLAPESVSESVRTRLDKHKPIADDFFEGDRSDLIAEAGVLLLRAKDLLDGAPKNLRADGGAKLMVSAISQSLQIGVKRSPKLAEIVEAWSVDLDSES